MKGPADPASLFDDEELSGPVSGMGEKERRSQSGGCHGIRSIPTSAGRAAASALNARTP